MKVEDQTLPKQTSFWWECGWGCFWCLVGENSCDSSDISLITWATRCSWDVSPYSGASKNRHSGEKSNKCTYSAASKNRKASYQTFSSPTDRPLAQSHHIKGKFYITRQPQVASRKNAILSNMRLVCSESLLNFCTTTPFWVLFVSRNLCWNNYSEQPSLFIIGHLML